jgi:hypothetical protein
MQRGTMVASIMEMNLLWATCDGQLKALVYCSCNFFRLVVEQGRDYQNWQTAVSLRKATPNFYRPTGVHFLVGCPYDWVYSHAWQNAVLGSYYAYLCWLGADIINYQFSMVPLPAAVSV